LPHPPDENEPARIARAAEALNLDYVVLTSVTRDDLPDGGSGHFVTTLQYIKRLLPETDVEVLTPDFAGDNRSIEKVVQAHPVVFNHNIETVPRYYELMRPGASYARSLQLLETVKRVNPDMTTKSGFMIGFGEERKEVYDLMRDLRSAGCDILTIGQYLQPTRRHIPPREYITDERFDEYREYGLLCGFSGIAAGPFVRSSYNAVDLMRQKPRSVKTRREQRRTK
jgi:lipoic acid synthetase